MARVLIACEFSGTVRRAFRALGHDAWSCDLLPAEDGASEHFQGDIRGVLGTQCGTQWAWDMMSAHPPCTYLSRAGWSWVNKPDSDTLPLKGEPRRRAAFEAAGFFNQLLNAPIPRICVENPRPIVHVGLPPPCAGDSAVDVRSRRNQGHMPVAEEPADPGPDAHAR
jgi:hypothetical protein